MVERTVRDNEALPKQTFNTRKEEEMRGSLSGLIDRMRELLSKKDAEKSETLVKRMFATEKMDIDSYEQVVRLKDDRYSYVQFIDLVLLCVTKKKPNNSPTVNRIVEFMSENEIPPNLIVNPYIKQSMADPPEESPSPKISKPDYEMSDSDDDTSAAFSRKKGSRAMVPLLRQPFVWYKALNDVPSDE